MLEKCSRELAAQNKRKPNVLAFTLLWNEIRFLKRKTTEPAAETFQQLVDFVNSLRKAKGASKDRMREYLSEYVIGILSRELITSNQAMYVIMISQFVRD